MPQLEIASYFQQARGKAPRHPGNKVAEQTVIGGLGCHVGMEGHTNVRRRKASSANTMLHTWKRGCCTDTGAFADP
jgi:hypothetical protein